MRRVIKPVPALSNIAPSSSPSRDSTLTLTVSGDGFVDGASLVQWNGEDLPTTFESTSELSARISPQRLSTPGDVAIVVFNPEPGGGTSTSMTFTVTEAEPSPDLFVPVVVSLSGTNGSSYTSELTLTNKTDTAVTLSLRDQANSDGSYAGPLMLTVDGEGDTEGNGDGIFLGARTMTPGGGGQYGFFYLAVPAGTEFSTGAWLYGMQQDSEDRTNLGLLTTSSVDSQANSYAIDLYDGSTGLMVQTLTQEVSANQWAQIEMILEQAEISQGYAHVKRTAGANDFITYAVINDGGQPNERSDDGAFVPGVADIVQ